MATTKRGRKKDVATAVDNSLLLALQFIAIAQRDIGSPQQTHCILRDGWAVACDGVLTAGHPIHDDLSACPQTRRLVDALQRCKEGFSLTQADGTRLQLKAGPFRASIPCIELADVPVLWADPCIAPIGAPFLEGCKAVGHLATEGAQRVVFASVLMAGPSVAATNGAVIAQYWHGIDLPPHMVIPKTTIAALLKCDKKLTGFGCSSRSVTFHYEDGSWLKSQCYEDRWPDIDRLFDRPGGIMQDVPEGLFEAVQQVAAFSDNEQIYFEKDKIVVTTQNADTAEYDVPNVIAGSTFGAKRLLEIAHIAKQLDTSTSDTKAYFLGSNLRGVIMKMRKP